MYEMIVIGGGPAGLAAALAAWEKGLRRILIVERDRELGGILNQCIHNGFGLHRFKEELTGPEYAGRFVELIEKTGVEVRLDTMALHIVPEAAGARVHMVGKTTGYRVERTRTVVLAMGCRERTRGAIGIPGTRPAGVFTAGTAQRYVNMEGWMPGNRVVILGSGDIGLIMARRMTLEGARVLACVEVMPSCGGLNRNIVQCLQDYDIPLYLSHTVTEIRGKNRVEQVVVSQVDARRSPIPGTEMVFDCDTLLLSVGLIPENELSRQAGVEIDARTNGPVVSQDMQTSVPGVFACGNVAHVHDLVDFVTEESQRAGASAADYVLSARRQDGPADGRLLRIKNGDGVGYTLPQRIAVERVDKPCTVAFRVNRVCGPSRIVVTDSASAELAAFHRDRLAPGEMERVALPREILHRAAGDITLSVAEKEGNA